MYRRLIACQFCLPCFSFRQDSRWRGSGRRSPSPAIHVRDRPRLRLPRQHSRDPFFLALDVVAGAAICADVATVFPPRPRLRHRRGARTVHVATASHRRVPSPIHPGSSRRRACIGISTPVLLLSAAPPLRVHLQSLAIVASLPAASTAASISCCLTISGRGPTPRRGGPPWPPSSMPERRNLQATCSVAGSGVVAVPSRSRPTEEHFTGSCQRRQPLTGDGR